MEFQQGSISWEFDDDPVILPEMQDIVIKSINPKQQIYAPNETAYIEFEVRNSLETPYNITVTWFQEGTRYHGWFNISTELYDVTQKGNSFQSWYPATKIGEWEVQLLIGFSYKNQTFTREAVTNFKVI